MCQLHLLIHASNKVLFTKNSASAFSYFSSHNAVVGQIVKIWRIKHKTKKNSEKSYLL